MYIFQVHHYIKPEGIEAYKAVTLENAQKTRLEPGVLRFEFFQDAADPSHFSLFEVYADMAGRDAHLQTEHFLKWKDVYLARHAKAKGMNLLRCIRKKGNGRKRNHFWVSLDRD